MGKERPLEVNAGERSEEFTVSYSPRKQESGDLEAVWILPPRPCRRRPNSAEEIGDGREPGDEAAGGPQSACADQHVLLAIGATQQTSPLPIFCVRFQAG